MFTCKLGKIVMVSVVITVATLGTGLSMSQTTESKKFSINTLQQVPLGELPRGKWNMKATMVAIEPGGEIPPHVHKGPGLRYVVEGEITINWKEGKSETFKAGSTFFEGAGENHPAGNFSAKNSGKGTSRVIVIELDPQG